MMKTPGKVHSIVFKLFITLLAFVIAAVAGGIFITYTQIENVSKKVSRDNAELHNAMFASQLSMYFTAKSTLLIDAAQNTAITRWVLNENNLDLKATAFTEIQRLCSLFTDHNMTIIPASSKHVYEITNLTTFATFLPTDQVHEAAWFKTALTISDGAFTVSASKVLQTNKIYLDTKMTANGKAIGVISSSFYTDQQMKQLFLQNQQSGSHSVIIDKSGNVLIASDINKINMDIYTSDSAIFTVPLFSTHAGLADESKNFLNAKQTLNFITSLNKIAADKQFLAISPIQNTPLFVMTYYGSADLFGYGGIGFASVYILVFMTALVLVLSFIFRNVFFKPLYKLEESMRAVSFFKSTDIYGADRLDEFGNLARNIKSMANNLVGSVPVGIFIYNPNESFAFANPYFLRQFDVDSVEQFNTVYSRFYSSFFANPSEYRVMMDKIKKREPFITMKANLMDKAQNPFRAEIHLTLSLVNEHEYFYEGILINVEKQETDKEFIIKKLYTDPLTSIYNRAYFNEIIAEKIAVCKENHCTIHLIILDLDHFKKINDKYGHAIGDMVLKRTARIMKNCIRENDILVRWGGEEFAIIIIDENSQTVFTIAERIRKELEKEVHPTAGIVTASLGFSRLLIDESYESWFKRADAALYVAKASGRNRVAESITDTDCIADSHKLLSEDSVGLEWNEKLCCGDNAIDEEHRFLVEKINDLFQHIKSEQEEEKSEAELLSILDFINTHFTHEEDFLKTLKEYPTDFLQQHLEAHQFLRDRFENLYQKIKGAEMKYKEALITVAYDVLVWHIFNEDAKFFPYIGR